MARNTSSIPLAAVELDPAAPEPLYRQLYGQLRGAILERRLAPGLRLPSTRALAAELGVSRNTVLAAFEQLAAEGYLAGRTGSGTTVAGELPEEGLRLQERHRRREAPAAPPALSRRGTALSAIALEPVPDARRPAAFRVGLPALDAFPLPLWARLNARQWRRGGAGLLGYGEPAGYGPLRQAIAAYLGAARGVRCDAGQVILVAGSMQAIDLAARLLLDPGDEVWMEDPGFLAARAVFIGAGARLVPVPVDGEGLDVRAGLAAAGQARLAYVSPSHQFPLGVTMSLPRRLALLEWAARTGAWVLEDDYDSEYRYAGRPLAALQGLDHARRVIYVGTFSEVLFPALRLGYMVVPRELADRFVTARALADRHSPLIEQAVLADFMAEGHFARHIRRMRLRYRENLAVLLEAVGSLPAGTLEIASEPAGMHLVGWLPPGVDDETVCRRLAEAGVEALPLSRYALSPLPRGGLVLGYAGATHREIRLGVRRMKAVLGKA